MFFTRLFLLMAICVHFTTIVNISIIIVNVIYILMYVLLPDIIEKI